MSEVENKCFFEFQVLIKWNSCKTKKLWLFHVYSAESYWWNHGRKSGLEKLSTNIGIYKSIASKLLNLTVSLVWWYWLYNQCCWFLVCACNMHFCSSGIYVLRRLPYFLWVTPIILRGFDWGWAGFSVVVLYTHS